MFSSITDIEKYLERYIPSKLTRFPGDEGIIRTKEFLRLLGSPQNKLKIIHVAGTSGKGSTSYMISSLLIAHGFKVGLHLSPHLLDIRERTEINNAFIDEKTYMRYFEEIIPALEQLKKSNFGTITYFEVMVGFVYYVFCKEKVDYAVIEVGLGGKYDGTNVIDRKDKLSVVTRIGLDHTKVLGTTLSQIAYHKAMICADGGELITIPQVQTTMKMIKKVVNEKNGHLSIAKIKNIEVGLKGKYQKENASLAVAAVTHLAKRDGFVFDAPSSTLKSLRFKGRFDVVENNKRKIILDGAHNPQKIKAFLRGVQKEFPHKKFTFVIAFKHGKEYIKMLTYIIPLAQKIIITTIFSDNPDLGHLTTSAQEIQQVLQKYRFTATKTVKTKNELKKVINICDEDIICTGSLYLVGDIYSLLPRKLE
jgi:dihydrofolate synthase/folylpolyglutamate synthase